MKKTPEEMNDIVHDPSVSLQQDFNQSPVITNEEVTKKHGKENKMNPVRAFVRRKCGQAANWFRRKRNGKAKDPK